MVEQGTKIFHESWYRIANQRISLRPSVRIHRQFYRGAKWYVLFDPFTNKFYRMPTSAYDFVVRLSPQRTVEEVWYEVVRLDQDTAPGQGEIMELLGQLYQSNMLQYDSSQDSLKLFERHEQQKQRQLRSTLLNLFYLRIPLFDPDPLLKAMLPVIRLLFSKGMAILWLVLVGLAGKLAFENWDQLRNEAQGMLAPDNLFLLYITSIAIKSIHEFGHSAAVRRFGGEVHTVGLMFMLLAPLPYMDATAAWSFRERWQRVLVAGSGMLFEFFVAALALVVWTHVGGGAVKSVAYNVFFIASVTTFLFNINPLMRFDGYYMLADLLDLPNLQRNSSEHLQYLLERYVFRRREATSPSTGLRDATIFTIYGILSSLYKFVIFGGILVAISQHFLLLALIMGIMVVIGTLVAPAIKFVRYVWNSPNLVQVRSRAIAITTLFFGLLGALLSLLPVPDTFTAPGIIEAEHFMVAVNHTAGLVDSVYAPPGKWLQVGDTLMILSSPELKDRLTECNAALDEANSRFYEALANSPENMQPLAVRIEVLGKQLAQLEKDQANLVVRAEQEGVWTSPYANDYQGKWLRKGDSLGEIIDTTGYHFTAVIPQEEVSRVFASPAHSASVRLKGQAFQELTVDKINAIPMEQNRLPSVALGWQGGGEVETNAGMADPQQTAEPFYELRSRIAANPDSVVLKHGRSGKIRFHLGYQPLLPQGIRKLRQALQKYYRF